MDERHAVETVIVTDNVHRAPIRQPIDGELRDRHKVRVVIQRGSQYGTRLRQERKLLGVDFSFRTCDSLVDEQFVAFLLSVSSLDEITNLAAQRIEHLQQVIIRLDNLAVIKGHDAIDVICHWNGKGKRPMKPHTLRDNRAWKI